MVFIETSRLTSYQGVVYLGTEWSNNPVVRSDIVVSDFLDSVGGYRHKVRRDHLLGILDVDLDWSVGVPERDLADTRKAYAPGWSFDFAPYWILMTRRSRMENAVEFSYVWVSWRNGMFFYSMR